MGETDCGGKLGLVLMSRAILSESLIQFSVDGQGCVPSLLFDLRPNYGGGNEDNGDLPQKVPCIHCHTQCPEPAAGHCQPMSLPEIPGHSQASLVSCGVPAPFSWVLVHTGFCLCPPASVSPVPCTFRDEIPLASKIKFPGGSQFLCQIPSLENLLWAL